MDRCGDGVGPRSVPVRGEEAPVASLAAFVRAAQVEARKDVDDATKNALKAKRDQAREARRALEKQLKDQLGKKREAWPPEKDDELYLLEEAEALAEADYEYPRSTPRTSRTRWRTSRVHPGQGHGRTGRKHDARASAAEADLVLEVAARRSAKTLPTQLKPTAATFSSTWARAARWRPPSSPRSPRPTGRRASRSSPGRSPAPSRAGPPSPSSPTTGRDEFGCQGAAANAASAALNKFIEDNYALLTTK